MYVPARFRETRPEALAAAIRDVRLAALVTPGGADGVTVSHVPVVLRDEGGPDAWVLETHVARPNPHWRLAAADAPAPSVAVFRGPHHYVSPSWYASKREHGRVVPTWTYVAVHCHGLLEAVDDRGWLLRHVAELSDAGEAGREHPWAVSDAPPDYVDGLARAIVGLRLRVSRVEGAWKMNQHRPEADRAGTIAGLAAEPAGAPVAEVMRALEAARSTAG